MGKEISVEELAGALRRMAMETGSLICLGCGYEHGCSVHGCAVLREAAELLERRRWISVEERPFLMPHVLHREP